MLLRHTILAARLILAASPSTNYNCTPNDVPALPIAFSEARAHNFVSLITPPVTSVVTPEPDLMFADGNSSTPTSLSTAAPTPLPSPPSTARPTPAKLPAPGTWQSALRKNASSGTGHIVKVHLSSHRIVVGRLVSASAESFSLRVKNDPKPVEIRYDEVIGKPNVRVPAREVIGDCVLVGAVLLAIPALPFLFLGMVINGNIAD